METHFSKEQLKNTDNKSSENENIEPKTELAKAGVDSNTEELLKVIDVTKANQIKTMSNEELLNISGMTEKRLKALREIIPSSVTEKIEEANKIDDEIVEKIVSDNEVFSSDDLVEIVETSKNEDMPLKIRYLLSSIRTRRGESSAIILPLIFLRALIDIYVYLRLPKVRYARIIEKPIITLQIIVHVI